MSISSLLHLNAAKDRFRQRGRPLDPMKAVVGDGNGVVHIAGTNKIIVELFERGSQQIVQAVLGTRAVAEGEVVTVVPLEDRAPMIFRVVGRQSHSLFARLVWTAGPQFAHASRVDEPWLINTVTGEMTPIGTYKFAMWLPEVNKNQLVSSWRPMGEGNSFGGSFIRCFDKRISWYPSVSEPASMGGSVYKFVQYHPTTGWVIREPDIRIPFPAEAAIGRPVGLDVDDLGNAVLLTTTFKTEDQRMVSWRASFDGSFNVWLAQTLPPQPPIPGFSPFEHVSGFFSYINAGYGADMISYWTYNHIGIAPEFSNIYRSDRIISDHTIGLAGGFFYNSGIASQYLGAWRANGGVYQIKTTGLDRTIYFGSGNIDENNWSISSTFTDDEPFISTMFSSGLVAPYSSGVIGLRTITGPSSGSNPYGATYYYGPAIIGSIDTVMTIWFIVFAPLSAIKQAIVTVVEPSGFRGRITHLATSNGRFYFTIGSFSNANSYTSFPYTNPYIEPGVYEIDPGSFALRQVCGMPDGFAPGGWQSVWGDRASAPAAGTQTDSF